MDYEKLSIAINNSSGRGDPKTWDLGTLVKFWPGRGKASSRVGIITKHLGDRICLIDSKPVYYYAIQQNLTRTWCNLTEFQKNMFFKEERKLIENHLKQIINE